MVAIVFHITAVYFNEIFATHPDSKTTQTVGGMKSLGIAGYKLVQLN